MICFEKSSRFPGPYRFESHRSVMTMNESQQGIIDGRVKKTYNHSRAVARNIQTLCSGCCVGAQHHQQQGQNEHAQHEPLSSPDPHHHLCSPQRREKPSVVMCHMNKLDCQPAASRSTAACLYSSPISRPAKQI